MPEIHSKLSPSAASRWLTCTPCLLLEESMEDNTNDYAKEGTLAHSLGEKMLLYRLDKITAQKYASALKKIKSSEFYKPEMLNYITGYADFVMTRYEDAKAVSRDAVIEIEQRLDFSKWAPGGFGTGDAVIVTDGYIEVIDLKYGQGVRVKAYQNPQLMLYGLGAYESSDFIFDIEKIQVTVYQPRVNNNNSFEIKTQELLDWAENVVKPQSKKALAGEGDFVPGEHCRFCRAGAACRARSERNIELARFDFCPPELLSDDEIVEVLTKGKELSDWVKTVEKFILAGALKGRHFKGIKLVEGSSKRIVTNTEAAILRLQENGFEDVFEERKLLGIGKLEKIVGGRKQLEEIIGDCIVKPKGKPTLAATDDNRQEYSSADMDFEKIEKE